MPRLAVLFLLIAAWSAPVGAEPITIVDAAGRTVTLPDAPRRIVPIFSSNAELVAALGLADRIVGVEAFTRYPPELAARPKVGGRLGFSVDAVVDLAPDLVIVTPARQAMHQLVSPMERLGVPVMVLLARDVDEVLVNLRLVGQATGEAARGEAVAAALEARLATVSRARAGRYAPRVALITGAVGAGLVLLARADTYTGDALRRAGARLAIETKAPVPQASVEAIAAADPDVLLFAGRREDLDALLGRPGWNLLRAVREGRAHVVSRAEFLIPGPRTVDGVEKLAALLDGASR
ncbi:ABC transporter substrate-binding protein [Methylopila henanensis]|uniref:ABC transporter substrate-binding protein n=1 Tax=Methylopila henanensis TaxID=873516 RepID=A0ABW4KB46_9HYPH